MKLKRIVTVSFIPVALVAIVTLLFVATPVQGEGEDPWYFKPGGWNDYAPSGVPDFDQKQAGATNGWRNPGSGNWSFCGPVAVANSLWWFDSKQEPHPATPLGPPYPTPNNDHYYLVTSYGGQPPSWDDHDPANVGGGGPALVDDLAWYMDTDGIRTTLPHSGTEVHDMSYGLQWYLYGGNPDWLQFPYSPPVGPSPPFGQRFVSYYDDYHVQLVKMPPWDWVVEEVERSEDVILLLGFWQET